MRKSFSTRRIPATPAHPDIKKVAVNDDGAVAADGFAGGGPSASALYYLRRLQTFADKKRSTLDAMRYSAEIGLTAHLDQTLFPTPGPLHPNQILSNLDQYKMYDPWLELHRENRATVRLQINFLKQSERPGVARAARAPTQPVPVLRRRHGAHGLDRRVGRADLGRPRVARSAAARSRGAAGGTRTAVQNLAALQQVVEAYEQMNAQYGITDLRWCVHHVPEVTPELLSRLQALGCGVRMAGYRWVTSNDPNQVAGAAFRTIVDHGIQVGLHGDGVHIAPLNPWQHIYYATTGLNSFGQQVNPGQHLTREEALGLFTKKNAWFLRMEDKWFDRARQARGSRRARP